jgi:beta-galactosidase
MIKIKIKNPTPPPKKTACTLKKSTGRFLLALVRHLSVSFTVFQMSPVFGFQDQIIERKFMPLEFRKQRDTGVKFNGTHPHLAKEKTTLRHLLIPVIAALSVSASVFAVPVPIPGDAPVPVDRVRLGNTNVIPMTGVWRFKLEHGTSPAVKGELPADAAVPDFASPDASDAGWSNIPVPANWEIEGFSMLRYKDRLGNVSDDIGLYRRLVDIPAAYAGQRVLWHFDGVYNGAEVFVNGQRVGYHESGFTAFDMDVTEAIKPGRRNLFAVRVYKKTPSSNLDKGCYWCLGGIYRETYLVALPQLRVDDLTVVTDLDAQYKDAALKSTVRVAGPAGAHFVLTGELFTLDGAKVALKYLPAREDVPPLGDMPVLGNLFRRPDGSRSGNIGPDGTATVTIAAGVTAPKLWSAEKPNLYYVFYRLSDGGQKVVERVQDRIGFRKVEMKGGVVQVNGVPVKFTGVCRHEEFSIYGHALTEECWKTDILLMKAANINAIRTTHYPHAERFMELCDEAGFYLLDEISACWIAEEVNNASRTWAYTSRTMETVARDKNRACVVAWSCGNESGYGKNDQAEFDYVKAHDPTRLAFISQQNLDKNPKTDFEDYHYPRIDVIKSIAASSNRAKAPAFLTEYSPSGGGVAYAWDVIWPSDSMAGAFLFQWQDEGMVDKFPDRWPVHSPNAPPANYVPGSLPAVDGIPSADMATGMRLTGGPNAVTTDRQTLKPLYYNLKLVYSPVNTTAREVAPAGGQCVVPLQNRYSFTDLSELTCRWQALAGDKVLATGESHVAAKPRSTVDASFPATPGMDTLRLEFIHPDGRGVYTASLRAKS